jgi:inner membrane protein
MDMRTLFADPRSHAYIKLAVIAALCVASLVPLQNIRALIAERQQNGAAAAEEIAQAWGGEQRLIGPVLVVPYSVGAWHVEQGWVPTDTNKYLLVLPEALTVDAAAQTQIRHRSIYETVVYGADVDLKGHFTFPDLSALGIAEDAVAWHEARLDILVSDLANIVDVREARWSDNDLAFHVPHAARDTVSATLPALPKDMSAWPLEFSLTLDIRGSGSIGFLPIGSRTDVSVTADWPHPSFAAPHLPATATITNDGFSAAWQISRFARALPQAWTSDVAAAEALRRDLAGSAVVARLVDPVDHYLKGERSVKYGVLFVILVACTLFVFETVSGLRFHPVQYAMVVAALCLFFLLLVSLSEVLGFSAGYGLAAIATVTLLGHYVSAIARSRARGAVLAGLLGTVYGALFVVLQSEAHALLLGSGLLFATLALAMLLTRHLDWYALGTE